MAKYNPQEAEEKWQKWWKEKGIYKFDPDSDKPVYSIDTPPPTVSGKMHIGHAFSYAQQDFIARYKKMKGFNVFYPFGTDDNGIPTEQLVEKKKEVNSNEMSREEFIQLCMDFLDEELPSFIQDWKRLGMSCDFDNYYSTIDEHSRKISQWSFIDLYNKERTYRKESPSMWCPKCQTGVSQAEAEDKNVGSQYNHLVFKVEGEEDLTIATTRPELLPACVAVFYHPTDDRFKDYEGKMAKVPLFGFEVPIIEDPRADPEKGTGIVMCCTFGDQTDMEWQKAHDLPIKEAINKEGRMTGMAGNYEGLPIKEARKKMIRDLKGKDLLVEQEDIQHEVNVHERCDTELEIVNSKQWFVKYLDLREDMLEWGSELEWYPEYMKVRYDNWVKGLQWDWVISRQRHFGVPFPIWYCKECGKEVVADKEQLPVNPLKDKPNKKCECGSTKFDPEEDVLDTWFTSALTPRLAVELMPDEMEDRLFPMDLRPQAHDIITFWLFKTVVKSNLHFDKNPFDDVVVSGHVLDEHGEKMSKSKGNAISPQEVLEEHGADALRYMASGVKLGEDIPFKRKDLVTGKKFINKILNAAYFVFMNIDERPERPEKLEGIDRIFLRQLNGLIEEATENFDEYKYSKVKHEVDKFFWQDFADNYIEIVKGRVYNGSEEEKQSALFGLYKSLLAITKMMAPITPFVAEEIWDRHFKDKEEPESIHLSRWPEPIEVEEKEDDVDRYNVFIDIIEKVRKEKSENDKSLKAPIRLSVEKDEKEKLEGMVEDLKSVTNAREINTDQFNVEFLDKK